MMKSFNILAGLLALLTLLNLSGCIIAPDIGSHHSYRNERGDLVIDSRFRYVGWCDFHIRAMAIASPRRR